MADTCRTPTGEKPFSFGMEPKTLVIVVTILSTFPLLAVLLGPVVANRIGRFWGFTLRKRTEGRRAQLLSVMNEEDEKYQKENPGFSTSSSEEWEAVDGLDLKITTKDGKSQKDWDGIIGFFHPFWYVRYSTLL